MQSNVGLEVHHVAAMIAIGAVVLLILADHGLRGFALD